MLDFVVHVCYFDWDSLLWLLVILLKILLIMLSWYSFSFNTYFILTFSLFHNNKHKPQISKKKISEGLHTFLIRIP